MICRSNDVLQAVAESTGFLSLILQDITEKEDERGHTAHVVLQHILKTNCTTSIFLRLLLICTVFALHTCCTKDTLTLLFTNIRKKDSKSISSRTRCYSVLLTLLTGIRPRLVERIITLGLLDLLEEIELPDSYEECETLLLRNQMMLLKFILRSTRIERTLANRRATSNAAEEFWTKVEELIGKRSVPEFTVHQFINTLMPLE